MSFSEAVDDWLQDAVMDFHGQWYSTILTWIIITLFAFVGFIYGYVKSSFYHTVLFIMVGTGVCIVVCGLPWPPYGKNKIPWKKRHYD